MKKYNLSEIMHKAWKLYRKGVGSFAEALHRAWNSAKAAPVNAQRIEEAQQTAGITEPVNTWAGWKAAGYMVEHGAKALFQAVLIHSSKGDGQTYRASFFGASQVKPLEAPPFAFFFYICLCCSIIPGFVGKGKRQKSR